MAKIDGKYKQFWTENLLKQINSEDSITKRHHLISRYLHQRGQQIEKILANKEDDIDLTMVIEQLWDDLELARKQLLHTMDWKDFYDNVKVKCKDAIEYDKASPEKQDKQKSIIKMKTPEESLGIDSDTYNEIVDACIYDEQKPDDKVEPKFHKGEWIVFNGLTLYVEEVVRGFYITVSIDGNYSSYDWNIDSSARLWTLKDAKDGDVLYAADRHCYFKEYIFMFSSFTEDNVISTHFGYDVFHGTFDKDITRFGREEDFMFVTPATKKRRELLFQKMKENDYELDSEKKELKKILITPRFEIGDVLCDKSCTILDKKSQPNFEIIDIRNNMYICDKFSFPIYQQDEYELVAKRIKQNSTWNEEDEYNFSTIFHLLDLKKEKYKKQENREEFNRYSILCNWLKFLKDRYTRLPSEEKVDNQNCIKPANKEKPKFHEGDWVILTAGELSTTLQIVSVDINKKLYWFNDSSYLPIVDEGCLQYWAIQDAKDCDVLQLGKVTAIFKELIGLGNCKCYCSVCDGEFEIPNQEGDDNNYGCHNATPATKEQRDSLLKAMADAGWEFNFEKKELKRIKQKPVSITDEWIEDYWQHEKVVNPYSYDKGEEIQFDHQGFVRFCKKYCRKPAWSEKDEEYINDLIGVFDGQQHQAHSDEEIVNWLKTLKNKYV